MINPRLTEFCAGATGDWVIRNIRPVMGPTLPPAHALSIKPVAESGAKIPATPAAWVLHGLPSNARYTDAEEKAALLAKQEGLGRPEATCAALLPIRKTAAWWDLPQDARRRVFEAQSHHTQIGLRYLPAIARRLYHCRDLSTAEPFDFLTWFEFRPEDEPAFDHLLAELRRSPEWTYVDREVDVRLVRI